MKKKTDCFYILQILILSTRQKLMVKIKDRFKCVKVKTSFNYCMANFFLVLFKVIKKQICI